MEQTEEASLEERLKSALWLSIGKIVDEETIKLGVNATPQFIGALTEMVWAQIETVSQDLESFAKKATPGRLLKSGLCRFQPVIPNRIKLSLLDLYGL
ncbi:Bromodomain transcription factor [Penicillium digitatum]|uniref:Bromodomain transcription factor n=1 Tax=Penicillium digitatum TaxID=36651 RepID=A0A7T6XJL9_PENDI|nr:Bromodomain transcription factor [Penicillium digitatum]